MEVILEHATTDLQTATREMQRNYVSPETVNLYNAESVVHDLLPDFKPISKLIGKDNKRVVTIFSPSQEIETRAINGPLATDVAKKTTEITKSNENERVKLDEPLEWDNFNWDF